MAILINAKFTCRFHSALMLVVFMQRIYYAGFAAYFHVIPLQPAIIDIINGQSCVVAAFVYSLVNH
jgi:hypothetical protein